MIFAALREWTKLTEGGTIPGERFDGYLAPYGDNLLLIGGRSVGGIYEDVVEYDVARKYVSFPHCFGVFLKRFRRWFPHCFSGSFVSRFAFRGLELECVLISIMPKHVSL